MLGHVVRRARQAQRIDLVVVATSDQPADDVLARYCGEAGIPCFRGNEVDVLDRYYQTARHFRIDVIVRLTADCPLLDPEVIDSVVGAFQVGDYDYVANILDPSYPDGLDTEVFSLQSLERAWREAKWQSEREHVTAYIWNRPDQFRLGNVSHTRNLSHLRWTVDEPEDLEFVRRVYGHLRPQVTFGMADVLAVLAAYPDLARLNAGIGRNEGYRNSIRGDRPV